MGTKTSPGQFDAYQKAAPDEPVFTLLGRDPIAPFLVGLWVGLSAAHDPDADQAKMEEGLRCAHAMEEWLRAMPDTPDRAARLRLREAIVEQGEAIAEAMYQSGERAPETQTPAGESAAAGGGDR